MGDHVAAAALLVTFGCYATVPTVAADEIALSFVHGQNRIDVPASAIDSIEALHYSLHRNTETGKVFKGAGPNVEICFDGGIGASLCELTKKIVGEPLEVWVSCRPIMKAVVREPLCSSACYLWAYEADQLVSRLNAQPKLACP
jgi:hypothetical protein